MAKDTLANITFSDDDTTFFDIGADTVPSTNVSKVIGNVIEDDFDDDDEGVTKVDTPKDKRAVAEEAARQKEIKAEEDKEVNKLGKPSSSKEEKPKEEKKPQTKGKAKDDEEEEEEEPKFFEDTQEEVEKPKNKDRSTESKEKKADVTEPKDEDVNEVLDYTALALALKDRGTLNFDIKEEDELTEDDFLELHEQEIESRVEETIDEISKGADEEGKAYLKHLSKGGKSSEFFAIYKANNFDLEELDEEDKGQVTRTLRHYLTTIEKKTDEEEIEDRIKYLQDSGKDKTYALKYFKQIKDKEKAEKEALEQNTKLARENTKTATKKFNDAIVELVAKEENILGVPFTQEDKRKIPDYLTRSSVKVGPSRFATPFQVEITNILRAATPEYKKKLLIIAKLAQSNFEALKDLATEKKTEVVKEVRRVLRKQKATNTSGSVASGSRSTRSLSDMIDG